MKKVIAYSVVAVVLIAICWQLSNSSQDLVQQDETEFSWKDTANLSKVFLANKSGDQVALIRARNGWKLEDGQTVRTDAINSLLVALSKMTMRNPVPLKQEQAVLKRIATTGVKVELYDLAGRLAKVFYVGGGNQNRSATYMMMEGAKHAYLVHIQGFKGYLSPRFLPQVEQWGSRSIIRLKPNQIDQICLVYSANKKDDFCIDIVEEQLTLKASDNQVVAFDSAVVSMYLDRFANVVYEGRLSGQQIELSAFDASPFFTLNVKDYLGRTIALDGYRKPAKIGQRDVMGNEILYDVDRFYAIVQKRDTVLMQYYATDAILLKRSNLVRE